MSDVVTMISTIGFPAACFLLVAWFLKYVFDNNLATQEKDKERYDKMFDKISDLTAAVNHNSEVLADMVKEVQAINDSK